MQNMFSMCAVSAHPFVQSLCSGARCFVHSALLGARCFVRSGFSGARCFVHCVCILCTLLALSSCEKAILQDDSVVSGSAADKAANLTVTVFEIEKTPFGSLTRGAEGPLTRATNAAPTRATNAATTRAATPASEACTRLNFAIYDEDGSRVKQVNQTSAAADFGKASFQLEPGDYTLVVVGHSSNGNPTMTNLNKIQFTNAQGYTETFLCCATVTIAEDPVEVQVSLDRIVSMCRFVLTDDIPSDVKKLQFYYTGGSGAFNALTGLGSVNSKQTVTFDVSSGTQKQFDLYTFLHEVESDISLTVTALDASGVEILQRSFDVPMEQNHITWLTGAFFNGSGSSSITITGVTVNTDWAGETHLTF